MRPSFSLLTLCELSDTEIVGQWECDICHCCLVAPPCSAFNKHQWWIKTLASSLFREVTYVRSFPVVTHSTCTVYFNLIFINRLRWRDAYLHMYMLFLVENLYKNSFFTTCGNQFSCYVQYQTNIWDTSTESSTIFTETVHCRSSFFWTR